MRQVDKWHVLSRAALYRATLFVVVGGGGISIEFKSKWMCTSSSTIVLSRIVSACVCGSQSNIIALLYIFMYCASHGVCCLLVCVCVFPYIALTIFYFVVAFFAFHVYKTQSRFLLLCVVVSTERAHSTRQLTSGAQVNVAYIIHSRASRLLQSGSNTIPGTHAH